MPASVMRTAALGHVASGATSAVASHSSDPLAWADGRCSVHPIALGSMDAGGAGTALFAVTAAIYPALRLITTFMRNRQQGSAGRWPAGRSGGAGYGQGRTQPDAAGPADQPVREHARAEQDSSYWEPKEEDGTLPADGFIGDPAETDPPAGRA